MKLREFLLKIKEFDLYAYDFVNSTSVPNVSRHLNIEFHDNQHYDLNLDGISRDIICEYLDSFDNLKYEISV
jgi:hypothetical protein